MKTLVLGLGNPVLADDSVGLRVAQVLRERLRGRPDVEVDEEHWGGLRLMERLVGYDRAVIIDAICTEGEPGAIRRLGPGEIPTQHSASAHDVNLPTALALGRQAGAHLPADEQIVLVAIEARDVLTLSESCTPKVAAAVGRAADEVVAILDTYMSQGG